MRFLKAPFVWIIALFALAIWPIRLWAKRRILKKSGWVELNLEGEVLEILPEERVQERLIRQILKQPEPKRVLLKRLRQLVDELIEDPYAEGMLVRLGPLGGGWVGAQEIHAELMRLRKAGKQILIHIKQNASNKELMVASAATKLMMPPTGMLMSSGSAAPGLFLKGLLDKIGFRMEVASAGRFKSAPDQFTRNQRSEADLEQTKAIVDTLDEAIVDSLKQGRGLRGEAAKKLLENAPMVGLKAAKEGYVDEAVRDEELLSVVEKYSQRIKKPRPMGARKYLTVRRPPKPVQPKKRHIGVVKVHGAIVDQAPGGSIGPAGGPMAVEGPIVANLRAALKDQNVAAVVLSVNSRGGSVTASDAIYAAVKRLNQTKPVIACFHDVAASGGYYVACGARSIVASPLTITGSIGVFSMIPTWPALADRLNIGRDVVKNHKNADLYNPWSGFDEDGRDHAQTEVRHMYDVFLDLVSEARRMDTKQADAVAQGRVWTGRDAHREGLVDSLGGFQEAVERARKEAGGFTLEDPVIISAKRPQTRPSTAEGSDTRGAVSPSESPEALAQLLRSSGLWDALMSRLPNRQVATEMLNLWLSQQPGSPMYWAWSPIPHQ